MQLWFCLVWLTEKWESISLYALTRRSTYPGTCLVENLKDTVERFSLCRPTHHLKVTILMQGRLEVVSNGTFMYAVSSGFVQEARSVFTSLKARDADQSEWRVLSRCCTPSPDSSFHYTATCLAIKI